MSAMSKSKYDTASRTFAFVIVLAIRYLPNQKNGDTYGFASKINPTGP
jgi:hypothetical protein